LNADHALGGITQRLSVEQLNQIVFIRFHHGAIDKPDRCHQLAFVSHLRVLCFGRMHHTGFVQVIEDDVGNDPSQYF
jgi:hypothetical protein